MGSWVKTNQPCFCGNSSDGMATDSNGNSFCFGKCGGKFFRGKEEEAVDRSQYTEEIYEHRGLRRHTLELFGVKTKFFEETPIETAFFWPNGSIQVRGNATKSFRTVGDYKAARCYGTNIFDRGSRPCITITEGAYDALAVVQMIGERKTAGIAIRSVSTAKVDIIADYDYINSFDKIIINLDGDEPGQEAAKKIAALFDFKKVFNLKLSKYKDANEYLIKESEKDYFEAWNNVKRYTPDNILSTMSEFRKALKERRGAKIVDYPFTGLQEKLYGIHEGEVVLIKAPEGVGKSEFMRAIENKTLKATNYNVGIIHLEESNGETLKGLAGYFSETPVQSPDMPASDEEIEEILEKMLGKNEDRFVLYSAFDVEDENKFIDDLRFMVVANNCKIICFDHISWLAVGGSSEKEDDERKKLDRIAQRVKMLAEELRFGLVMVSHVNDAGQTRGSRYISKAANTVIDLKRNKTTEDESERTKLHFMVEKARLVGSKEGPAGFAVYNTEKLMLEDPLERGLQL
jgi:twinkle protein